jgi:hypothetical protein
MCVTVSVGDVNPRAPIWDHDEVSILISSLLTAAQAALQVRTMLMWLGAPQGRQAATCWCGEPVELPTLDVPWAEVVPERTPALHREMIYASKGQ